MFVRAIHPWSPFFHPSPFPLVATLRDEFDRWCGSAPTGTLRDRVSSNVQLRDEGEHLTLTASLPGVKPQDLQLTATSKELRIRAERKIVAPEGYAARHRGRHDYVFERAYELPFGIEPDQIQAKLTQGILSVKLPKAEQHKPRTINVQTIQ